MVLRQEDRPKRILRSRRLGWVRLDYVRFALFAQRQTCICMYVNMYVCMTSSNCYKTRLKVYVCTSVRMHVCMKKLSQRLNLFVCNLYSRMDLYGPANAFTHSFIHKPTINRVPVIKICFCFLPKF